MPFGGTIAAAVIGGGVSMIGASKAANAQTAAADKASQTQLQMFNTVRGDLAPYNQVGTGALYSLADLYGLPTATQPPPAAAGGTGTGGGPTSGPLGAASGILAKLGLGGLFGGNQQAAPPAPAAAPGPARTPFGEASLAAFRNSPDYKFAFDESMRAVNANQASRGLLRSGSTLKAISDRASGLASQNFSNYVSRLMSLAGLGESAASQTGSLGVQTGQGVANSQMAAGEAQAAGYVGGANAFNQALGTGMQNLAYYQSVNSPSSPAGSIGAIPYYKK